MKRSPDDQEQYLNIKQTSQFLNVKEAWLRYAIFKKQIPFFKFGKHIRFGKKSLIKWTQEQLVTINKKRRKS